ncbi:MAG: hypothetical protein PHU25_06175 [Deltaproteobacteria bacterium]|nr:hypothetical protein [Deltaproteobacteria bacterium]
MDDCGRTIPPSRERLAAAARAGWPTGSGLFVSGLVLMAAAASLAFFGERAAAEAKALVAGGLRSAVSRADPAEAAAESLRSGLSILALLAGPAVLAGIAFAVIPAVSARRGRGRTAVALPRPRPPRLILGTIGAACALAMLTTVALVWRRHAGVPWRFAAGEPGAGAELWSFFVELTAASGAIAALFGLAALAVGRHARWRALHLTPSEAKREERASAGSPRARGEARGRLRSGAAS